MYKDFFHLRELPFSIVPNSRFIFLSGRHREALNHLQAGLGSGGGFALLTGEVGTGKTTVSKALLANLEANVQPGLLLNPTYTSNELLEAICDEFSIEYPEQASLKQLTQAIHQFLLANHAKGIQTLVLIDEAQHLSADVLEQLRLLTNLETDSQKLLKVLLIGQPELQHKLQTPELRQLAQRITGRYHLLPLSPSEVSQYIEFRLHVAGAQLDLFSAKALKHIGQATQGIPRLINLVCDKCLQYAYYSGLKEVDLATAEKACQDVMVFQSPVDVQQDPNASTKSGSRWAPYGLALLIGGIFAAASYFYLPSLLNSNPNAQSAALTAEAEPNTHLEPAQLEAKSQANNPPQIPSVVDVASTPVNPSVTPTELTPLPQIKSADHQSFAGLNQDDIELSLAPYIAKSRDRVSSLRTLYRVWGYDVSRQQANCQSASRAQLACFEASGSLSDLRLLNRPAILSFYQDQKAYFAVLYRLGETNAELLIANKRVEVPVTWIEENWSGEFSLLWHNPYQSRILKRGDQGKIVAELERELSQALGENSTGTEVFNATLERKVEAFQMWQGINVDGIAGTQTLMLLDSYVNHDAPLLTHSNLSALGENLEGDR
ncbi:MAG: ExeA family protein [Vibrio sp.]